jgi:hypothetical protein
LNIVSSARAPLAPFKGSSFDGENSMDLVKICEVLLDDIDGRDGSFPAGQFGRVLVADGDAGETNRTPAKSSGASLFLDETGLVPVPVYLGGHGLKDMRIPYSQCEI